MRRMTITAGLLGWMCAGAFGAFPLATNDAGTVAPREFEVEAGYDTIDPGEGGRSSMYGFSFTSGITQRMDLNVAFPYTTEPADADDWGKTTLTLKGVLVKDLLALSCSAIPGESEYLFNGILSRQWRNVKFHANLGCVAGGEMDSDERLSYNLALEYPVHALELVAESLGGHEGMDSWLAAVRYRLGDSHFVSVGYGDGFREPARRLIAGLHTAF